MNISELYQLTPQSTSFELWEFQAHIENHVDCGIYTQTDISKFCNQKIETRVLWRQDIDCIRYWLLASVWFDNKLFGIIQNAGRYGRDHLAAFWTDMSTYVQAIQYFRSLLPVEDLPEQTSLECDTPKLLEFYDLKYGQEYVSHYW
jgi:hypothetical protein